MTSNKKSIALLTEIFVKKGFKHIVISPGSRNAPVIISFTGHPDVKALSIVDERSAAFFALGIAQQTGKTVAISCTSGSAALNYAPAIAEAYYQRIPLLVLTADRPPEMIDIGDGQTIRQKNVYANYIKKSYELPETIETKDEMAKAVTLISEAIDNTLYPVPGPVHINLPFAEPIYGQTESHDFDIVIPEKPAGDNFIPGEKLQTLADLWNNSRKKLILAGLMPAGDNLEDELKSIISNNSVFLLSETTSNLPASVSCTCIDKIVSTITPDESKDFRPDILLTFGGHVVSKMVKKFLRENKPRYHFHIDPSGEGLDTFGCLTDTYKISPLDFFKQLLPLLKPVKSSFKEIWRQRSERSEERHNEYLKSPGYSDLKVFEVLLQKIPENSLLHLGNSTPVRYVQLFKPVKKFAYFSNRGVSGIDGTVSTAAGAAFISNKPVTIITGDLAFLYDSNALMNRYLSDNLRLIVINNSGGDIFRFIPGPDSTNALEEFFVANHNLSAKYIAKAFNVNYSSARNLPELETKLNELYKSNSSSPAILEIFTQGETNSKILREYFNFLK